MSHGGNDAVLVDVTDLKTVLLRYVETDELVSASVNEVTASTAYKLTPRAERLCKEALEMVSDGRWSIARERIQVLRDLLNTPRYKRGESAVQEAAQRLDRSPSSIYRLLSEYDKSRSLRVMLRLQREDKGKGRLLPKVERAIRAVIKCEHLVKERPMIKTTAETIQRRCRRRGWPVPSQTAITQRIKAIAPVDLAAGRLVKTGARGKHEQSRGHHPVIPYPLQLWQMDHTPSNYCIVDEVHRLPLEGEQTLSIVLDIGTRCVMGFTLFIEKPSVRVAGSCLVHAILPKESFLEKMGVGNVDWPCYGFPSVLYTDSGPDFKASGFLRALDAHNIEYRRRPKKSPNYAGSIEGLFSKFLRYVHQLPGTRFSNLKDRLKYDSLGRAIMTIHEFRQWFTIFITKRYHQMPHSALEDLPSIKAWERGIVGHGDKPGIGLPDRVTDEFRLKVDFLPCEYRTVGPEGIQIDRRFYQGEELRQWVGAKNPNTEDGKFACKYDPFEMSEIYFLDPELGEYFPIQCTDKNLYATRWELKLVRQKIRQENRGEIDQSLIDEGAEEMRDLVKKSAFTTHAARRTQQRHLDGTKNSIPRERRELQDEETRRLFSDVPAHADLEDEDEGVVLPSMGVEPAMVRGVK